MKMSFKKAIALLVCICFVFSFCVNNIVSAADSSGKIDESIFKVVQNDDKVCTIMAVYKGDKLYATLDKETNEITMKTVEKPKAQILGLCIGKARTTDYKVKVDTLMNGKMSAVITDTETGKEYKISKDSDKVKAQAVVIIPLIDILADLALRVLAGIVLTVVLAGVTYYALSELVEDVEDKNYDYYAAYIHSDDVYIAGAISFVEAVERLRNGDDILAKTQTLAHNAAMMASYNLEPVGPEKHSGSGHYYWHYHLHNRVNGSHAFYID